MYNRWYRYRKVAVLATLVAFVVELLPEMAGALGHVLSSGAGGLGVADFAADTVLLVALGLALIGVAGGLSAGRWLGRGVGLYRITRIGGGFFVFGTVRPLELLALFGAGVLVLSLPPPERAYEGGSSPAGSWRRWLGGWALAFNVGLLPVMLAPINGTMAAALGDSLVTLALVASALAVVVASGALLVLASRTLGLLLFAVADLSAMLYFGPMIVPSDLGHHDLLLVAPATLAALVAASALALPALKEVAHRSVEPIL